MKRLLNRDFLVLLLSLIISSDFCIAQGINTEKNSFINFLKRQYEQENYEGIRLVEDYDKTYIISVLALSKNTYSSSGTMFRVAKVKATQQIGAYIDGTQTSSELLVRTTDNGTDSVSVEKVEIIRESSNSFVKSVEYLTSFPKTDNSDEVVFIYSKEIEVKKTGLK